MRLLLRAAAGVAALVAPVAAQIPPPPTPNFTFTYRSSLNPNPVSVNPNGLIQFGSVRVGMTNTVTFIARNAGTVAWTITEVTVSGATFRLGTSGLGEIRAGEDRLFTITFTPTVQGPVEGTLTFKAVLNEQITSYTFFLAGTGLAPDLVTSYILGGEGNQIIVGSNDTISFPNTEVGQSSTGTFVISNRGNGPGTVTRIALTGASFRLSGVPLLPATVDAGRELRFSFLFSPTAQESSTGALQLEFGEGSGAPKAINLTGLGIGATFVYEFLVETTITPVPNNGTFSVPSTGIGSTAAATVRVRNTGNGEGRVTTIAVSGPGFQLSNVPFLPANLPPGQMVTFSLTFSPSQSGAAEGRLRIDNAVINLIGTGVGSSLTFNVRQGTTIMPLPPNGTVNFPNTTVGARATASIQINNTGNAVAQLSSISFTGDAYSIENVPALPVALLPGQGVEFTVNFAPAALGSANGTLQIDGQRVNLAGVGVPPPALPAVAFGGASGTVEPGQQPAVSLSIGSPYPLDITGRLTLAFTSDAFVDDPAIQFSTGGRTVAFTIPAGATQAIFGRDATQIQFQTGTVAGTISVTASFTTGAVDVTPTPSPLRTLTIAAAAPVLRGVQIGSRSASSFEVLVTGYSTLRSVTDLNLQFTPTPGANLQTTTLNINVDVPFSTWYRSGGSTQFGSQFTAAVTILVNGDINAVQSVSATAANPRGASNPVSVNLR